MSRWTLARVRSMVEREGNGATLYAERETTWHLLIDAPPGKILRESGCHCSAAIYGNGFPVRPGIDWKRCADSIKEIISLGFEDCDDPDCDVCNEGDEP